MKFAQGFDVENDQPEKDFFALRIMYLWSSLLASIKGVNTMTKIRAGTSRRIYPTVPPPTPQGLEWPRYIV